MTQTFSSDLKNFSKNGHSSSEAICGKQMTLFPYDMDLNYDIEGTFLAASTTKCSMWVAAAAVRNHSVHSCKNMHK
jgi:hypothetical protein